MMKNYQEVEHAGKQRHQFLNYSEVRSQRLFPLWICYE